MRSWLASILLLCTCFSANAQNSDINLVRYINTHRDRGADNFMDGVSNSVLPVTAAVPVFELAIGYLGRYKNMQKNARETIVGLAANTILTYGLKYAIDRDRPYDAYSGLQPMSTEHTPSFPSSHTSYAFYTATMLTRHYKKWWVAAPAYTWASLVGYSRLHQGVHYPSDVIFGAVFGVASSVITTEVNKWLIHKHNQYLLIEP